MELVGGGGGWGGTGPVCVPPVLLSIKFGQAPRTTMKGIKKTSQTCLFFFCFFLLSRFCLRERSQEVLIVQEVHVVAMAKTGTTLTSRWRRWVVVPARTPPPWRPLTPATDPSGCAALARRSRSAPAPRRTWVARGERERGLRKWAKDRQITFVDLF